MECEGCYFNRPVYFNGESMQSCWFGQDTGKHLTIEDYREENLCSGYDPIERQLTLW